MLAPLFAIASVYSNVMYCHVLLEHKNSKVTIYHEIASS